MSKLDNVIWSLATQPAEGLFVEWDADEDMSAIGHLYEEDGDAVGYLVVCRSSDGQESVRVCLQDAEEQELYWSSWVDMDRRSIERACVRLLEQAEWLGLALI